MKKQLVGTRGLLITFEDSDCQSLGNTSIYLINTGKRYFLCDTYLGPEAMSFVRDIISSASDIKDVIVFNTHYDWDHIWGNCAFEGSMIIAHELCRKRILERGEYYLQRFSELQKGNVKLIPPNTTFNSRFVLEDEGIELIHAPGHTADSAICFDRKDFVLFAGDLIENPIPYISSPDLAAYCDTLELIKKLNPQILISAHSGISDEKLLIKNLQYVRRVMEDNRFEYEGDNELGQIHAYNVRNLMMLKYEDILHKNLGDSFDYSNFRKTIGDFKTYGLEELEEKLSEYTMRTSAAP